MSQNDFNIANQGFPATRADINSALQALASTSSGATEPGTIYAYQFWYDTSTNLLKMRNADNDAWITLAAFDQAADEWEVRTAVVQAVDSAGVVIKTDDGVARISVADSGVVTVANALTVNGLVTAADGAVIDNDGANVLTVDRATSDGAIIEFQKDGTTVGSIGSRVGVVSYIVLDPRAGGAGLTSGGNTIAATDQAGTITDGSVNLGTAAFRWQNLYLSGGVYLGGTGSANLLDDYEEGTWTPLMNGSVSMGTARYLKIGQLVFCEINAYNINFGSIAADAALVITNAPFTMQSIQYAMNCAQNSNISFGIFDSSGTSFILGKQGNAVDIQTVSRNTFGGGANHSFRFSFTYRATA